MNQKPDIAALSGGNDSTAMVLRLAEVEPNPDRIYLYTPTGDEMPDMVAHLEALECRLGKPLLRPPGPTLRETIDINRCLPSWRIRFCTRLVKLVPCEAWMNMNATGGTLSVGLRADEDERQGLYGVGFHVRFPMREWGWGINDVRGYLRSVGVKVPTRTDCARCFFQRLPEWHRLWKEHPDIYADAVEDERRISEIRGKPCTYRSPSRDTWPAGLADLADEFRRGRLPRGALTQHELWEGANDGPCRICRM